MEHAAAIEALAGIIELAVAPVFLLAGIAGFLNVLTTRLGRIIDRARIIERQIPAARKETLRDLLQAEISALWSRIRLINWSIRLCVLGALLVCLVIATLFIADLATVDLANLIAVLFVTALLAVVVGLILFLFEVSVSTRRMRQGLQIALEEQETSQSGN